MGLPQETSCTSASHCVPPLGATNRKRSEQVLLVSPTIISSASQAGPLSPVLGRQSMDQELRNRSPGLSKQQEGIKAKFREGLSWHRLPARPARCSCEKTLKAENHALTQKASQQLKLRGQARSAAPLHGSPSERCQSQQVALKCPM